MNVSIYSGTFLVRPTGTDSQQLVVESLVAAGLGLRSASEAVIIILETIYRRTDICTFAFASSLRDAIQGSMSLIDFIDMANLIIAGGRKSWSCARCPVIGCSVGNHDKDMIQVDRIILSSNELLPEYMPRYKSGNILVGKIEILKSFQDNDDTFIISFSDGIMVSSLNVSDYLYVYSPVRTTLLRGVLKKEVTEKTVPSTYVRYDASTDCSVLDFGGIIDTIAKVCYND